MKKCDECKRNLGMIPGLGYVHPHTPDCKELDDGVYVELSKRLKWDEKYPFVTSSFLNDLSNLYVKVREALSTWLSYFKGGRK